MFLDSQHLVTFGNKVGYQISESADQAKIYRRIRDYGINLKFRSEKYFKTMQQSDFTVLGKYKHLVCFNLDQPLHLLYFTKWDGYPVAIYIERGQDKPQMTAVRYRMDQSVYDKDTILEGEMLTLRPHPKAPKQANGQPKPTQYLFLISDILVDQGKILTDGSNNNYQNNQYNQNNQNSQNDNQRYYNQKQQQTQQRSMSYKLGLLRTLVDQRHQTDPILDPYTLTVKDFVEYNQLKSFYRDYRRTLPYRFLIKGLVFRPNTRSNKNLILHLEKNHFNEINLIDSSHAMADWELNPPKKRLHRPKKLSKTDQPVCFLAVPSSKDDKPDVYHLYLKDPDDPEVLIRYGLAVIPNMEISLRLQHQFAEFKQKDQLQRFGDLLGMPFTCKYTKRFKKWQPAMASPQTAIATLI